MKRNTLLVIATVTSVLLLSGCPAILEILGNKDGTTTTTTSSSTTTTSTTVPTTTTTTAPTTTTTTTTTLPPTTTTTTIPPTTTTSTTTTSTTTTTTTTTILSNQDTLSIANAASGYGGRLLVYSDGRQYIIQNKIDDPAATQTVKYYTDNGNFNITQQTGSATSAVSFPSIFIGNNNGHVTSDSNLPIRNNSINKIPTTWTWSKTNAPSASFVAAYELWFTHIYNANSITEPEYLLAIWLFMPVGHQPNGMQSGSAVINGSPWNVWIDDFTITYVANSSVQNVNFDLFPFINNAMNLEMIYDTNYLHDVIAGFKIWSGGTGLASSNFSVSVQ